MIWTYIPGCVKCWVSGRNVLCAVWDRIQSGDDRMEITAKCRYDLDASRALVHSMVYKGANPKRRFAVRVAVCVAFALLLAAAACVRGISLLPMLLFGLLAMIIAMDCFLYFGLPRMQFNALGKAKGTVNEYVFCEERVRAFTSREGFGGETEAEYSQFAKVCETSRYFFLFLNDNQALMVDKSTVSGGTVENLREKLSFHAKDKYQRCQY